MNLRSRLWTFLIYPDSAPYDWKEYLEATGKSIAISPCHNSDVNEETGELKKSHYHIVLYSESQISYERCKKITAYCNAPIPQKGYSAEGLYNYLNHRNAEGKYVYDVEDIQLLNGFDIKSVMENSGQDKQADCKDIINIIIGLNIIEFADLVTMFSDNPEYLKLIVAKATFFNNFIRSIRHSSTPKDYRQNIFVDCGDFIEIIEPDEYTKELTI